MRSSNVLNRCMAEARAAGSELCITLTASPAPGEVREWTVRLSAGATVADAFAASAQTGALPPEGMTTLVCGIWGRVVAPDQVLRDGDRVELYRPLTVDPKVARRERFARQGARTTGLFARQRPGTK